jgi:hypothetical protein
MNTDEPTDQPTCPRCGQAVTVTYTRRGTERIHAHNDADGRPCRKPDAHGITTEDVRQ